MLTLRDIEFCKLSIDNASIKFYVINTTAVETFLADTNLLNFLTETNPLRGRRITIEYSAADRTITFSRKLQSTTIKTAAYQDLINTLHNYVIAVNMNNMRDLGQILDYTRNNEYRADSILNIESGIKYHLSSPTRQLPLLFSKYMLVNADDPGNRFNIFPQEIKDLFIQHTIKDVFGNKFNIFPQEINDLVIRHTIKISM
jgi:hypothetical protein